MVVNRIGAVSLAKIAGILYALVGLLFGAVLSLLAMAGALGGAQDAGQGALFGAIFGVGAVVLFPVFYGGLGFVTVLIMALLYKGSRRSWEVLRSTCSSAGPRQNARAAPWGFRVAIPA